MPASLPGESELYIGSAAQPRMEVQAIAKGEEVPLC